MVSETLYKTQHAANADNVKQYVINTIQKAGNELQSVEQLLKFWHTTFK